MGPQFGTIMFSLVPQYTCTSVHFLMPSIWVNNIIILLQQVTDCNKCVSSAWTSTVILSIHYTDKNVLYNVLVDDKPDNQTDMSTRQEKIQFCFFLFLKTVTQHLL